MDTIQLTSSWDWTVDASGNWAGLTQAAGALAQDAASEGRLFLGEAWYDIARGVPYWQAILGHWPPLSLVRSYLVNAALLTPNVVQAQVFFTGWNERTLSGQLQVTDVTGAIQATAF